MTALWRIRLQLLAVEVFAEADVEDTGDHRVDAILRLSCGISLTPAGSLTLITYGPGSVGSPTTTARRAGGGNAGNGFHSMSSGSTPVHTLIDLMTHW